MQILENWEFEDSQELQKWFFNRGYQFSVNQCYKLWNYYSYSQHDSNWLTFRHNEEMYKEIIEDNIIPLIGTVGAEAVQNVFKEHNIGLTIEEAKEIAEKHSKLNKFKGWRDEDNKLWVETFTETAYNLLLKPIAKELGYYKAL